jgi:hypothetical protein
MNKKTKNPKGKEKKNLPVLITLLKMINRLLKNVYYLIKKTKMFNDNLSNHYRHLSSKNYLY